ncbi:hypothetical protein B0A53_01135 [Rhodotorula sp. CCFEE 5036]|nr:hypothetical protein B0A53_01135 [Rhodotorula sp. CCFEE 5036]
MNTPKRPLSAADHLNQHSPTSSCSPPPTKRAKPNTHRRQNGSAAVRGGTEADKPAWQRPLERLLDAFRAFVPTPSTASPSSTATRTLARSDDDDDESVFRTKDPRDHTRTRDQLEREIKALKERHEHLKRQYGHQVIAARRARSAAPDKPRELAEIPKRINHLRQIDITAHRRDDDDDEHMPRRANGAKQDGKGHAQNAPLAYARRQPMGKKEVRVVPDHRTPPAAHGPELTVTQPRSAPPPPPDSLPVLAHPSPLLFPPRSSHSSAVTDERPTRRRRIPSPSPSPPPPPPPPMGPSANPRPPWAPTWDPTTTTPIPKPSRCSATRPKPAPPTRLKQIRAKVKARDESDIVHLASTQPPEGAAPSSRPSFFTDYYVDEDGEEHAPEADEDAPIFDVYQQQVNAALSQEEAAWNWTSTPPSQGRSRRPEQRKIFPADLLKPSPNDLGSETPSVRPPYAPNYVKGTSLFSDYISATRPRKLFHARDSLAAAATIRRRNGGNDDDDDDLEQTTDRLRSVLDIARKSEYEITQERLERYHALQAKRKEDELEAQRILDLSKVKAVKKRRFPAKLSKEHAKTVQEIFSNRSYETSIKGAAAAFRDMNRLNGQDWLNDELINYYGVMINNRSDTADAREKATEPDPRGVGEERKLKAFCFNTNFFTMFCQNGFAKVKRWTRKFDTFEKDIIIIPVNHSNMHWCCAAVNIKEKRFEYYDSMGKPRDFVYQALRKWLKEEHKSRKGTEIDLSDWEDYWDPEVPRQSNADDCGVFTCMFMESLSRDCPGFDFNQKNMPYLRRRIALEIDKGELLKLEDFV